MLLHSWQKLWKLGCRASRRQLTHGLSIRRVVDVAIPGSTQCVERLEDRTLLSAGDLDPTFGNGGTVTTVFGSLDYGKSVAVQSDGKIVVVGSSLRSFGFFNNTYDFAVARYNIDGTLDSTFGNGGKVTTDPGLANVEGATSVAIQSDGKIVVSGVGASGVTFAVARYNSDSTLDTTFGGNGLLNTDFGSGSVYNSPTVVVVQGDGKIVVGGKFVDFSNGAVDFAVARYNSDGTLDTTFDGDGKLTSDFGMLDLSYGSYMAVQADGKILMAGESNSDFAVARFNIDGTLDTTFGNSGKLTTDFRSGLDAPASIAIQSDGKVLLAGFSETYFNSHTYDFAVARYNSDGTLDATFGTGGKLTSQVGAQGFAVSVAVQSDGKIVVAGQSGHYVNPSFEYDFTVVRYKSDGSLDTSFGTGGVTTAFANTDVYDMAIQRDGKIVVVGDHSNNYGYEFALARYDSGIVPTISEGLIENPSGVIAGDELGYAVAVQGDYAVVGAPNDAFGNPNGTTGSVYVFHRENGVWVVQQKLTPSGGADKFGNTVAIDGDTIVVGSFKDSTSSFFQGSAFVFVRNGSTWTQQQKLTASDGGNIDLFGAAVVISGDTLVVTASDDDGGVVGNSDTTGVHDQGSAYVFTRTSGVWTERAHLLDAALPARSYFGQSVAMSGDTIAIGSSLQGDNSTTSAAYIYTGRGDTWTLQQKVQVTHPARVGNTNTVSVSLSGDQLAIGNFTANSNRGQVELFRRAAGTWSADVSLTAADGSASDRFGNAVSLDGDVLVVGARQDDVGAATDEGTVHVFRQTNSQWHDIGEFIPSKGAGGDQIGFAVAVSGLNAFVGAPFTDGSGQPGRGKVYVLSIAPKSVISISATSANKPEGNSGDTPFTFTVTRTGNITNAMSIDYVVTGNGANASDFGGTLPSGTVSFDANQPTAVITIKVSGDTTLEGDEGFTVTLSNPSADAAITTATADGTILNDDASLLIAATDANKAEGQSGQTAFTFTVTRTGDTSGTASADYVVSGNDVDGTDFGGSLPSGTVNFGAGDSTATITINVNGDTTVESNESFTVTLSSLSAGATINAVMANGTILNDDASLSIAATDANKVEGNNGNKSFTFTVTRIGDTSGTASANYMVSGTAENSVDFGGSLPSGTVNFAASETSKTITINVSGDTTVESDEGFTVTLSSPSIGTTIATATATGTILNDDASLSIAATDANKSEGNRSTKAFTFTVTRTGDTSGTASANYVVSGNAVNGADFGGLLPLGTVSFGAGASTTTITINVSGDTTVESDESFTVTLSNPSVGATITTALANGTIVNDDFYDLVYSGTGSTVVTVAVLANGHLQVKLGTVTQPDFDPAFVRSLLINGGTGNDVIDLTGLSRNVVILNGVSRSAYPILTSIVLSGNAGNDKITGSADFSETISGGFGNDTLNGGAGGTDRLVESAVATSTPGLSMTLTNTALTGGFGIDAATNFEEASLTGSSGADTLNASAFTHNVTLSGGIGIDVLTGGSGNDSLDGGAGDDVLVGNAGDDMLSGGLGADKLTGNAGNDQLLGGAGNDTVIANGGASYILSNSSLTGDGNDTLSQIEAASITTGSAASTINASAFTGSGKNTLTGGSANDSIIGGSGADSISGGAGNDTLTGGLGNDTFDGGAGIDLLQEFGDVDFKLINSALNGLGTDTLNANSVETAKLTSGVGNNRLDASGFTLGSVTLDGGEGNDVVFGGSKNDSLIGGGGRDLLIGGTGIDVLNGSAGDDILIGGTITFAINMPVALTAIMKEWTGTGDLATRQSHLLNGGGLNGTSKLNSTTVKNDTGAKDSLTGGDDTDWFFQSAGDVLVDFSVGLGDVKSAI